MLTFKNHCGQLHKMNTALVALTVMYVAGAAAAISAPYWVSSTSALAPLAAFAATPLGIGILAAVAVALVGLAIYAISKNNEVSEVKAPKITEDGLLVTKDVYEKMKKNNQSKDENGKVIEGKCYINFTGPGDKGCRVTIKDQTPIKQLGNTLLLSIDSLEVKNDDGKYVPISDKSKQLEALDLNKEGAKEFNTYLEKAVVEQVASQEQKK